MKGSTASRQTLIGSLFVLFSQIFSVTGDAITKLSNLKIAQFLMARYMIQFIIAITWWIIKKPSGVHNWYGDKPYTINVWLRGITYSLAILFIYYGIILLPLGDAQCFVTPLPLYTAIIARIFLKEQLPKMAPLIGLVGIVGIIFISQPTFLGSFLGFLYDNDDNVELDPLPIDAVIALLIGVFIYAVSMLMIRKAKNAHFLQLEIASSGLTSFIAAPALLLLNNFILQDEAIGDLTHDSWRFDLLSIAFMIAVGILGFAGLALQVIGYQHGEATKVAWLEYLGIVFAFLYQIFLFKDIPNKFAIIGVILVVVVCLISLLEEFHKYSKEKRDAVTDTNQDEVGGQ